MGLPKISVIVPVYNAEKTIERLLDCLNQQSFKDFELILVDDGSKDLSVSIINGHPVSTAHPIHVYQKENGGPSEARNFGLEKATGEYICFIDADDTVDSDYLESLYSTITNSNSDLVVCGYRRENSKGKIKEFTESESAVLDQTSALSRFFMRNEWIGPWCKLYRRDIIEYFNLRFNTTYHKGEDFLFVAQYLMHSRSVSIVPHALYDYRYSATSITHSVNAYEKLLLSDQDNLKAHQEVRSLIRRLGPSINSELNCRYINTYLRAYLNLGKAGKENPALEEEGRKFVRDHWQEYIHNQNVSLSLKAAASLFVINPKLFRQSALILGI